MPRRPGFLFKGCAIAVMLPLDVVNVEVQEPFIFFVRVLPSQGTVAVAFSIGISSVYTRECKGTHSGGY